MSTATAEPAAARAGPWRRHRATLVIVGAAVAAVLVALLVGDRPVRASKKSAEWCAAAVARCWEQKRPNIRPAERAAAAEAFEQAAAAYRKIAGESTPD